MEFPDVRHCITIINHTLYHDQSYGSFVTSRGTIMTICPRHADSVPSLEVFEDHTFCHAGCGYLRRYASIALLLGYWNGLPETEGASVQQLKASNILESIKARGTWLAHASGGADSGKMNPPSSSEGVGKGLDSTFHRFLLSQPGVLHYFMAWRGLSLDTIRDKRLGYTGTHFTIPIYNDKGKLISIRYRVDDRLSMDLPKYSGIVNHNQAVIYDLPHFVRACHDIIMVTEGEYDSLSLYQLLSRGDKMNYHDKTTAITLTNGAGKLKDLPDKLVRLDSSVKNSLWVICTDQDDAGEKAAYELGQVLGGRAIRARWDMGKDISEFAKAGGSLDNIAYL